MYIYILDQSRIQPAPLSEREERKRSRGVESKLWCAVLAGVRKIRSYSSQSGANEKALLCFGGGERQQARAAADSLAPGGSSVGRGMPAVIPASISLSGWLVLYESSTIRASKYSTSS